MTRLTGHELLQVANDAVPTGAPEREDVVQDVALSLVQNDPSTIEIARECAGRAYEAARKRISRQRAIPVGEVIGQGDSGPHAHALDREVLRVAVGWAHRHGRVPSRTTIWRICRDLKQKP